MGRCLLALGPARAATRLDCSRSRTLVNDPYDALARFYDVVVPDEGADTEMYAAFARRLDGPVLELGVGTGRVAVPLARMGLTVWGIDVSSAMLERAREKAAAAGAGLQLEQVDLRAYRLAERFGLIYCAADSFLHLCEPEHQIAALRSAGAHLAPGGLLVLDLPALAGTWADWEPGARPLELLWSGPGPAGGALQHFSTFTADPARQQRHVTHIFDETDTEGIVRRTLISFTLRFIFPGELALLVAAAGLRLDALYGGYELEPFDSGSERMIAAIAYPSRRTSPKR